MSSMVEYVFIGSCGCQLVNGLFGRRSRQPDEYTWKLDVALSFMQLQ